MGASLTGRRTARLKDKRKHPRYRPGIEIGVFDKTTLERVGRLVDISQEGIMLAGGNPMKINTVYELRIKLPVAIYGKNEIAFNAICLWCTKTDDNTGFQAGFQLKEPSRELKELIEFWMKNPSIVE
jgi:hypothetical protein